MKVEKLTVIPEPEPNRSHVIKIDPSDGNVAILGLGPTDLLCGNCEAVIGKAVWRNQISNVVVYCNNCGSYNDIP